MHEKELSELIGIMLGDGCLSRSGKKYYIYICGHKINDFEYHQVVTQQYLLKIFNKMSKIQFRKFENTLFLRFSDKEIFLFFSKIGIPIGKKYNSIKIPQFVKDPVLFPSFIRGLFDTDGCFILSKQHKNVPYYPRIEITSKSEEFLSETLIYLKKMGFYGSVSNKGRGFRLEIPGRANLLKWNQMIGSNHPQKRVKMISFHSRNFYKQTIETKR